MKKICLISSLILGFCITSFGQLALVGPVTLVSGGTNNVAAATTNQTYGPIYCERHSEVALWLASKSDKANASSNTIYRVFFSLDTTGTNLTGPGRAGTAWGGDLASFVVPQFGVTNAVTNVVVDVGAFPYAYIKVTNESTDSTVTNLQIKYTLKRGL